MSQQSEERLPEAAEAQSPSTARILPFERPQSDLQRAIQLRAREAMALDRDRDRVVNKPPLLRWIIILVIAMIPVFLMFGAVDGFLRALQQYNRTIENQPATPAPEAVAAPPVRSSEPGVILLQPYIAPPASNPEAQPSTPAETPSADAPAE